jgi:hypothetical protein
VRHITSSEVDPKCIYISISISRAVASDRTRSICELCDVEEKSFVNVIIEVNRVSNSSIAFD